VPGVIDVATDESGPAPRAGSAPSGAPPSATLATTHPGNARDATPATGFSVRLDEFEGPFDLLLSLIAKHRLDVTVLAMHTVIDDFLAHVRAAGTEWDLDEATEFLVVAATLLDLKAARLLPSGEVEDEEDLALLEARDLLFARLLQYSAYKDVSAVFADMMRIGGRRHPREVGLDPEFSGLLPEVLIGLGPLEFAALAASALAPRPTPTVSVGHIHAVRVSVREQAAVLVGRLRRHPSWTFRGLTADCDSTLLVVARFLALLELYREGAVAFDQVTPLGELHIRWTGASEGEIDAEEYDGQPVASSAGAVPAPDDGPGAAPAVAAVPADEPWQPGQDADNSDEAAHSGRSAAAAADTDDTDRSPEESR
jgi:segregation and condensation protein A